MSFTDTLDSARLKCSFDSISIIKPSSAGNTVASFKAEILESCLFSQTDELDVVSNKHKPSPNKIPVSALCSSFILSQSHFKPHVSFASTPSSSLSAPANISQWPQHPVTAQIISYNKYLPIDSAYTLNVKQKQSVLSINLRHLHSDYGIPTDQPAMADVFAHQHQENTEDIFAMELEYPDETLPEDASAKANNGLQTIDAAQPAEIALLEDAQATGMSRQAETIGNKEATGSREVDNQMVFGKEQPERVPEDEVMIAPDEESAIIEVQARVGQVTDAAMPATIHIPSVDDPPKPSKAPPSHGQSLFLPKPLKRPLLITAKNSHDADNGPPAKKVNWANTVRSNFRKPSPQQVTPAVPKRRGRLHSKSYEDYHIQDDQIAKHPSQRTPISIAERQATGLVKAIQELCEVLSRLVRAKKLQKADEETREMSTYQQASSTVASAFDIFEGCKNVIRLDFLQSRPEILSAVADFANSEDVDLWPPGARRLKRRAQEMTTTWRERFNGSGMVGVEGVIGVE